MPDEVPTWEQLRARINAPGYRTARGAMRWVEEDDDGVRHEGSCRFVQAPAHRWYVEDELGVQFIQYGHLFHVRSAEGSLVRYYGRMPSSVEPVSWDLLTSHLDQGEIFTSSTDYFSPAGPARSVEVAGRRAWEVTILPPPHKEFPIVLTIDDLTGTLISEAGGGGSWSRELTEFHPHVEVDYTLFHYSGPFEEAPPEEDSTRPWPEDWVPTEEDRERARRRLTILEGLAVALERRAEVLKLLADAPDVDRGRRAVADLLGVDELVATAVLDMQFRRLAAFERQKITDELDELRSLVDGTR